jgi:hypothetical protein
LGLELLLVITACGLIVDLLHILSLNYGLRFGVLELLKALRFGGAGITAFTTDTLTHQKTLTMPTVGLSTAISGGCS